MSEPLARLEFLYQGNRYTITVYPNVTHLDDGSELMRYMDVLPFRDGLWDLSAIIAMVKDMRGD